MSGNTDPFLVLVDDIGALRRQIENLQRTSLDRDEAEHLNATIAKSLDNMAQERPAGRRGAGSAGSGSG